MNFFQNERRLKFEAWILFGFNLLTKYEDLNPIFYEAKLWKNQILQKFRQNFVINLKFTEIWAIRPWKCGSLKTHMILVEADQLRQGGLVSLVCLSVFDFLIFKPVGGASISRFVCLYVCNLVGRSVHRDFLKPWFG